MMPREIKPEDTTRAKAYELWLKAPNPMVTFFKTFDVTNLIRVSRKNNLKFNMLMDYCIGKAAVSIKEFYMLLAPKREIVMTRPCFLNQRFRFVLFYSSCSFSSPATLVLVL